MRTLLIDAYIFNSERYISKLIDLLSSHGSVEIVRDVALSGVDATKYDVMVISGSQKNVSDGEYQRELLDFLDTVDVPVLGICYGFHLLGRYAGVPVHRATDVITSAEIRIMKEDPIFDGLPRKFIANELHVDFLFASDANRKVDVLAVSSFGFHETVEILKIPDTMFYGVQFHPEFNGNIGKKLIANFYHLVKEKNSILVDA